MRIDYCEVGLNGNCVNPPGYSVGNVGGMHSSNHEPGRTRKSCEVCGNLCCRGCRDRHGVCMDCLEDEKKFNTEDTTCPERD